MSMLDKIKVALAAAIGLPTKRRQELRGANPTPPSPRSAPGADDRPPDGERLAAQREAEDAVRRFNAALTAANKSTDRGVREYQLTIARKMLAALKESVSRFAFLSLPNLAAVEAMITAVETETNSMPYGLVRDPGVPDVVVPHAPPPDSSASGPDRPEEDPGRGSGGRHRFSANDERAILMSIQGRFRVMNESIAIARSTKNPETRTSRLRVARDHLSEARRFAEQFQLDVDGFDVAEAEIDRIEKVSEESPRTTTPPPQSGAGTDARTLLKEATALKRAKRYNDAVAVLRRAYEAPTEFPLLIEERLRLPMYLQLAGRTDEARQEMNRLGTTAGDQFSNVSIAGQMAIFLRKDGDRKGAALYAAWCMCKRKEVEVAMDASMIEMADQQPARDARWAALGLSPWPSMAVTGTTPSGNPIYDVAYPAVHRRANEDYGRPDVRETIQRDLAKVTSTDVIETIVVDLARYLRRRPPYDFETVKGIFEKHLP